MTIARKLAALTALTALMPGAAMARQPSAPLAYTVMAPGGGAVLRAAAAKPAAACPVALADGRALNMIRRGGGGADGGALPARPFASSGGAAWVSRFALPVCEAPVPQGTRRLSVGGRAVPVPKAQVQRIVILGDTGCRLKAASDAWQACNDPAAWPFARIARSAAALRPDLVLHVGDYAYRENPCPDDKAGCRGVTWGYGWAGWKADFLDPAAPLLAAAPWVMVRGNHEECARAGQGWWLLLDPHALTAGADCTDPARDFAGNHTDPYAVDLGDGARLIVADFSAIGEKALTDEAAIARYRGDAAMIARLAQGGRGVFVTEHPPLGGVVIGKKHGKLDVGYAPVGQAFDVATRVPELPGVTGVISGHVHLLQVVARDGYPVQVINGFSGTAEEEPRAPATLAELRALSDGAGYRDIATLFGRFGFGVMERMAGGRWRYTARDVEGRVMLSRVIEPR